MTTRFTASLTVGAARVLGALAINRPACRYLSPFSHGAAPSRTEDEYEMRGSPFPYPRSVSGLVLCLACAALVSGCANLSTPARSTRPDTPRALMDATTELAGTGATRLHPDYVWAALAQREADPEVNAAFQQAWADGSPASQLALIQVLELKFIHAATTSGLDLLGHELSEHFRSFDWHADDFPGGPAGPNEPFADVMVDALDLVVPERRANQSRTAVVRREEATDAVWGFVTNQWVSVPGQKHWMLNRHARESFLRMQEQAAAEGVDLVILSAHRRPEAARANAARAGNSNAVASFSSHSLGLAIDFDLSHRDSIRFDGLATRPMSELVRMRESPVHKWLALRAHEFGWYPYQNEPWHWEYNPPGFGELFWADFPGGLPERDVLVP